MPKMQELVNFDLLLLLVLLYIRTLINYFRLRFGKFDFYNGFLLFSKSNCHLIEIKLFQQGLEQYLNQF